MSDDIRTRVDAYIEDRLLPEDADLSAVLDANHVAGLPAIDVSPAFGKLLSLLARTSGARRVLEIGTLGGYSTAWFARALPVDGMVVSIELNPRHAEVARANLARLGCAERVEIRCGSALDILECMIAEDGPRFDLVFIDADKVNNARYLERALRLVHVGSLIVVDNVVRAGAVADASAEDPNVLGTRALFDAVAAHPQLEATAIQTVGRKGYDGFLIARVRA